MTSMAIGAPLLAIGSAGAFAESFRAVDHPHATGSGNDTLLDHLNEQMAAILRGVLHRGTPLRAEEARSASASLHTLAVHARAVHLDDRARRALQRRLATQGRAAVLGERADISHVRAVLGRRGVQLPEHFADVGAAPHPAERAAAVELVLAGNTSPVFTHMAATLDGVAPRLLGEAEHMRDVQFSGMCEFLFGQWVLYLGLAGLFCNSTAADGELDAWCEAMWQGALVADFAYWSNC